MPHKCPHSLLYDPSVDLFVNFSCKLNVELMLIFIGIVPMLSFNNCEFGVSLLLYLFCNLQIFYPDLIDKSKAPTYTIVSAYTSATDLFTFNFLMLVFSLFFFLFFSLPIYLRNCKYIFFSFSLKVYIDSDCLLFI